MFFTICFEDKRILDVKEKFLAKFVFLEKKQLSNNGKIQSFFSRKTNFAKNFSLMSKMLLSTKQIYIWFQFCEKVVGSIFLQNFNPTFAQ